MQKFQAMLKSTAMTGLPLLSFFPFAFFIIIIYDLYFTFLYLLDVSVPAKLVELYLDLRASTEEHVRVCIQYKPFVLSSIIYIIYFSLCFFA